MTRIEVLKKLDGKRFYSDTYGDMITVHDTVASCDDGRTDIIGDEETLRNLIKESGEE